jgi:SNF2 family DNA or RNA helicase
VFHEQGLGKTKIAIDLALTWLEQDTVDSILFLTKKSLIQNWCDEIEFHSFLPPRVIGQDRRANYYAFNSPARFYVAHYEACKSELTRFELFLRTRRIGVICDEAQKFKNPEGGVAKALFQLGPLFKRRVVMTGTPVANRPYDIWALIRFLDGGLSLGADYKAFKARFDLTADLATHDEMRREFEYDLAGLMERIRPFSVRETKRSSGLKLPSKEIVEIQVDLDGRQEELYEDYREELRSVVVRDGIPRVDNVESVVKRLLRLIQVASNPYLVDESYNGVPAKLPALEELLQRILGDGKTKAIVWSNFTANVDWLARELVGFAPAKVHGKLAILDRNKALTKFKTDPACKVLIATPGAAKEGLTLTVANHAVFFDRGLSLDDYLQAQDRIHRISQDRECYIYNIVARNTVDEWVNELLAAKELAANLVLEDIDASEYKQRANYGFVEALVRILGNEKAKGSNDKGA